MYMMYFIVLLKGIGKYQRGRQKSLSQVTLERTINKSKSRESEATILVKDATIMPMVLTYSQRN